MTDSNNVARGTLSSPTTRSTSTSVPYATSPRQANPRSTLYPPTNSHSPSSAGSQILPPISAAIPEILPANRVRAVSDTEALMRGGLSPSSGSSSGGGRSFRPPQPHHSELLLLPNTSTTATSSAAAAPHPHHPSLRTTDLHLESAGIDQRRHVGRSAVQGASGAHYPPHSSRGHSHSILTPQNSNSALSDDATGGQSQLSWPLASRSSGSSSTQSRNNNSIEYNASAPSSSSHEYSPHPFSSASLSARQGAGIHYPTHHVTEGQPHLSSSTSRGSERAPPPSSFPHHHHSSGGNNNRPRSGHSSEGDETKSGYGKYECEYCSKRFNRPSSLRVSSAIIAHMEACPIH